MAISYRIPYCKKKYCKKKLIPAIVLHLVAALTANTDFTGIFDVIFIHLRIPAYVYIFFLPTIGAKLVENVTECSRRIYLYVSDFYARVATCRWEFRG